MIESVHRFRLIYLSLVQSEIFACLSYLTNCKMQSTFGDTSNREVVRKPDPLQGSADVMLSYPLSVVHLHRQVVKGHRWSFST